MAEKGLQSPIVRRIITIVLIVGITGTFLAMYYLVYLPSQQSDFNRRMFRILHEIANNFTTRAENYGTVSTNIYVNKVYKDPAISFTQIDSNYDLTFKNSFKGNPSIFSSISSGANFKFDSITYKIIDNNATAKSFIKSDSVVKSLGELLEPVVSIHANAFESVLLVKAISDSNVKKLPEGSYRDVILYKSSGLDITNINTDSLFSSKNIQAPTLTEADIEGMKYKFFLMPFQLKAISGGTFILIGVTSKATYNKESHVLPLDFILTVVCLLIFLLLGLPFIKMFVLSATENISVRDIRLLIAGIFIVPFVITLLFSSVWLYIYPNTFTNNTLSLLQNEIKANFFKEICQSMKQAKEYDSIISSPLRKTLERYNVKDKVFVSLTKEKKVSDTITNIQTLNLKDVTFYPTIYRNIENIHWMDSLGKDIATWRFTKDTATYFDLKDRQYFKDIKYKRGYLDPESNDTFTIQPTLSKLTGEYTFNTVIPSRIPITADRKSIALGISSKMYSVYNTIIPEGYGYSLIDEKGEIIFDSDTARSLQENFLEESGNDQKILNAISHKDSTYIDDIKIYDESVKMIITPLEILPYYLVTYYNKRSQFLFIFHIAAFVFLCMSILLLFMSLFSYLVMITNKRVSKLFFVPGVLTWVKPCASKNDYYIRNCIQLLSLVTIISLVSLFLSPRENQMYMLNYALLLPLFSVTGYYIIKRAKDFIKAEDNNTKRLLLISKSQLPLLIKAVRNVILLYATSIAFFAILHKVVFYEEFCPELYKIKIIIWTLIFVLPLVSSFISILNITALRSFLIKIPSNSHQPEYCLNQKDYNSKSYLSYYLLSLLLSVTIISVIPAVALSRYALMEERKLHFQTLQLQLAKKIQERRTNLNPLFWQTKLGILRNAANCYVDSLKFCKDKGLYLAGMSLTKLDSFKYSNNNSVVSECSPFYRLVTQFLFLPPDHDEFFDDTTHRKFYYWTEGRNAEKETLVNLHYKNITDRRSSPSILLSGKIPDYYVLKNTWKNPLIPFVLLTICILVFLFVCLVYSLAKRVFLIGYFDKTDCTNNIDTSATNIDPNKCYEQIITPKYLRQLLDEGCLPSMPENYRKLKEMENQLLENGNDECVMKIYLALKRPYEDFWKMCTEVEKFTLYDFALDGFTNYRKVTTLYGLLKKGLLIKEDGNLVLMTSSFRNFLLTKESSDEIKVLSKQAKGSWSALRTVFYVILLAVAVFIFLSQEEASKRLITIVTSLGALLPAILKLFDKSTFSTAAEKK